MKKSLPITTYSEKHFPPPLCGLPQVKSATQSLFRNNFSGSSFLIILSVHPTRFNSCMLLHFACFFAVQNLTLCTFQSYFSIYETNFHICFLIELGCCYVFILSYIFFILFNYCFNFTFCFTYIASFLAIFFNIFLVSLKKFKQFHLERPLYHKKYDN